MFRYSGFTAMANEALNAAASEAASLGHTYIGSEHILCGLLSVTDSVAYTVLYKNGVTLIRVKQKLVQTVGKGTATCLCGDDLTPRGERIIENAISTARASGGEEVGTEHILMALLREYDSAAVAILRELGASVNSIYNECTTVKDGAPIYNEGAFISKYAKTETLNKYGKDLTELALQGKIDPVIGRDDEIGRVVQILSRRTKNNPCLIGEPGVGKTAVVEGLALKIANDEVPENIKSHRVFMLDLTLMLAGAKYRGDFEERIKSAVEDIYRAKNVILFIDEIHTIVRAGATEGGSLDAANILKPLLARGEIQIIGATTLSEYRKYIEKDSALERRFEPITVGEPTAEETTQILKGLKSRYENHHKIIITDEAINAAVSLSKRYIKDRFLPDKALDLIDEAAAGIRTDLFTEPPEINALKKAVSDLKLQMNEAINIQDFEGAARLRKKLETSRKEYEKAKQNLKNQSEKIEPKVTKESIYKILSRKTGIPVGQMTESENERLLNLEETLKKSVIGQNRAVRAVANAVRRGRVGIAEPDRPICSFIFLGPTGVGKTELTKALSKALFDDENSCIRLDMSEYMEANSVSKIIGAPPGYVGYDNGTGLTVKVRRKPYSVIVFDEIEKAHPDILNILLQVLEEGTLTDSEGRAADFKNTVIIMTSNIGAKYLYEKQNFGFISQSGGGENAVISELKKTFKPELLNRIDEIIVFNKLTNEDIKLITKKLLCALSNRLSAIGITADFDESICDKISSSALNSEYGARPIRREISSLLEDEISRKILTGEVKPQDKIKVSFCENAVKIEKI